MWETHGVRRAPQISNPSWPPPQVSVCMMTSIRTPAHVLRFNALRHISSLLLAQLLLLALDGLIMRLPRSLGFSFLWNEC